MLNTMRRALRIYLLTILALQDGCASSQTSAGQLYYRKLVTHEGFLLAALPPSQPLEAGSRIEIHVTLSNASGETLYFSESRGSGDFEMQLWENGKLAQRTAYGETLLANAQPTSGLRHVWKLAVGEGREYVLDVSRVFDMTTAGLYALRVFRVVPKLSEPNRERLYPAVKIASQVTEIYVFEPPLRFGTKLGKN